MKFKIFQDKKPQEDVVFFKLAMSDRQGHHIDLVCCDSTGVEVPGGFILSISSLGIIRQPNVEDKVGMPLDNKGKVMLYGEDKDC